MQIHIRQENPSDHSIVFELIKKAFETMPYSDHTEHFLVEKLRQSHPFIPELSLIAAIDHLIVGHILLTPVSIKNDQQTFNSLVLAPVSVLPEYQKRGIGSQLIQTAHQIAQQLGHQSVVLVGHKDYYPRFGYERADRYGIKFPFESPPEHCMVLELEKGSLSGVNGMVEFPKAFFEL